MEEQKMTSEESLRLIGQMIHRAKNSYHDSGIGPILWGSVITICSIVTWAQLHYRFSLPFDIWLLTMIAVIPQIFIVMKEKKAVKARRHDDEVMDAVWMCFGISVFLLVFINANAVNKLNPVFEKYIEVTGGKPDFTYGSFITSFFLLLYGIPTIITGSCRKLKAMLWGGVICWICCIASVYTRGETDMLLTAIAAISAWLIPGIILRKKYIQSPAADV